MLGPGSDADTMHVLRLLPRRRFRVVVDAGCGTGRQTLALAKELGILIHAIDSHQPFLEDLLRRATDANAGELVQAHVGAGPRARRLRGRQRDVLAEGARPRRNQTVFRTGYPEMQAVGDNVARAETAGYKVLTTHTLPRQAWTDGYYDILAPAGEDASQSPRSHRP